MKKRKIIVAMYENNMFPVLLSDLYSDDRVIMFDLVKKLNNRFLSIVRKIHLSSKVNKHIKLPFKIIWVNSLESVMSDSESEYHILFIDSLFPKDKMFISYLRKLKNKRNVKYEIILENPFIDNVNIKYYMEKLGFDYIFTFDERDAQKNGFIFQLTPFSMFRGPHGKINYDMCNFSVNSGNRLDLLHDIYKKATEHGISLIYRITLVPKESQLYPNGIIYNQVMPYAEVVKETKECNCILEVMKDRQTGATARYYEAVCYNKKLLTNNKNVVNLPFYNPDYIHVFEKPEDIDWNWVKERIPVDYHYDGRFSPTHLIDKIIELEEEKERNELGKVETD